MQFKHFIELKLNSVKIQDSGDPCGEGGNWEGHRAEGGFGDTGNIT